MRFWDELLPRFLGAAERALAPDALASALADAGDVDTEARAVLG